MQRFLCDRPLFIFPRILLAALVLIPATARSQSPALVDDGSFDKARASATIAGYALSKVQRWLHEVALKQIDPKTNLYISHHRGSARYREAVWNYDDTAADTYPFLFWAAWYTDHGKINGPILDVLKAEQQLCNHLDRIPTAYDPKTGRKVVKSKDNLIFAATEYVKDGLIPIVEVAGKDNPWFERMRGIIDDIWKHADVDTPYGKIPTKNLEANGEHLQVLARLFTATGDKKYLAWAERLADYYLLKGDFVPGRLQDHGCEIIGGLGLLLAVESVHNPKKAEVYRPHIRKMLDEILNRGTNEDGLMYHTLDSNGRLSDGWGYNYVSYLIYDMVADEPVYRDRVTRTLRNLAKPEYASRKDSWDGSGIDGYADSVEGGLYLINRLPVPQAIAWVDAEVANNIVYADQPDKLWTTYKLDSNGVRTVLIHALMHTRGLIARPWQQGMQFGAAQAEDGLAIVIKASDAWEGKLVFDIPRHRHHMGFKHDWPRMNTMPQWYTVELDREYIVKHVRTGTQATYTGRQLHDGLPLKLKVGEEVRLMVADLR